MGAERKIPWWVPEIGPEEYGLVKEVLDANYLNEGDVTERFERAIAERLQVKHAVATTSGTSALALSLIGLGVGHGDEVIVPDVTFIATANAVTLAGATPILADVDPRTLNLDPRAFERAITRRTKAVMPVHVTGRAADMRAIGEIAKQQGLFVVEDAAEGFTSKHEGRYLGTFGDAGCLSFSPNKTITTGQGGAVLTNNGDLHRRLRELKDQGRPVRGTGGDDVHHSVGFNFKLTNLQAAVGLAQLTRLEARSERARRTYRMYAEGLRRLEGLRVFPFRIDEGELPQWTDVTVERRDELDRYLLERNVHCRRFWFPLHTQAPYRQSDAAFPNSTKAAPSALWLPSAFTLTDGDVETVIRHIHDFFARA